MYARVQGRTDTNMHTPHTMSLAAVDGGSLLSCTPACIIFVFVLRKTKPPRPAKQLPTRHQNHDNDNDNDNDNGGGGGGGDDMQQ